MKFVKDLRVGIRLGAAFAVVAALLCVVAAVGLSGGASQGAAARELTNKLTLTRDAMQTKFRAAEFNGWQTTYAYDVARGVSLAADRKAFEQSASAFRSELAIVAKDHLTTTQQAAASAASQAFETYLATDAEIIRLYRQGSAAAVKRANSLV